MWYTPLQNGSLKQAVQMVKPNCYLASDVKDTFYSVPIDSAYKKYLKFMWVGQSYQYNVMPNGYVDAVSVFTKILKPVFAYLREQGYTSNRVRRRFPLIWPYS